MHKVILDVDPGIDDTLALLFASLTPQIELLGVTVVAGNVNTSKGCINALHALHAAGNWQTPLFVGAEQPLCRPHQPAEIVHGSDGFGGLHTTLEYQNLQKELAQYYGQSPEHFGCDPSSQIQSQAAADFLLQSIATHPNEVNILAVGPLTNIALALQREPQLLTKIKRLIVMGGAAARAGNVSPVAEYNFHTDPEAAQQVFAAAPHKPEKLSAIGLDVTAKLVFSPNLREIVATFAHPLASFIYQLTRSTIQFHWQHEQIIGSLIHDALIPAFLVQPELLDCRAAHVEVCAGEGAAMGQSIVDFGASFHNGACNAQVALGVQNRQFFQLFLTTLFPEQTAEINRLLEQEFPY